MQNLDPVVDDLSAVQADDLLLTQLGSALPDGPGHLVDDELNALLLAWRGEVESLGFGDLVDLDTAAATIAHATPTHWNIYATIRIAVLAVLVVATVVALTLTARGL